MEFQAEVEMPPAAPPAPEPPKRSARPAAVALATLVVLAIVAVAIAAVQFGPRPAAAAAAPAPKPAPGTLTFTSEPAGATVAIDSVVQGTTPLKIAVPAGQHQLEVVLGATKRTQALSVDAGATITQHYEFAAAAVAQTGRLEVISDPPGARVSVDGTPHGTAPLTIASIAVGEHRVTISNDSSSIQRQVNVAAGATATVMATIAPSGAAGGWAQIKTPVELQVYEGGQLIATTSAARFMLPAGRHDLEVANDQLEFRAPLRVDIEPGKTTAATVPMPNGSLSVNALPWAEILIDGRPAGPTPIGNLAVPIGTHEIVWRHPQLGERKRTVSITAQTPVRIGMDLSK
jgi:hypothetical protein